MLRPESREMVDRNGLTDLSFIMDRTATRTLQHPGLALAAVVLIQAMLAGSAAAAPARVFVSPQGNDRWSGRVPAPNGANSDGPCATLEGARDVVRRIKAAGLQPGGVEVQLLAGRYQMCEPLELTAVDSGTEGAPIVYCARPGDTVRISGGRLVGGWRRVSDPELLRRLDPAARGQVYEADLAALGIFEYGDLGLDAAWQIQHYLATVDHQGEDAMLSLIHI